MWQRSGTEGLGVGKSDWEYPEILHHKVALPGAEPPTGCPKSVQRCQGLYRTCPASRLDQWPGGYGRGHSQVCRWQEVWGEQSVHTGTGLLLRGASAGCGRGLTESSWNSARANVTPCVWGGLTACNDTGWGAALLRRTWRPWQTASSTWGSNGGWLPPGLY